MHYVTPQGYQALKQELTYLLKKERPKIVEVVSWAAGNGDRSENGDYIYGKKRLREIDRRVRYLTKQLEDVKVVDPESQKHLTQVFFGASVTYYQADKDKEFSIKIVGIDEANISEGKVSYNAPIAKALFKHSVGDLIYFDTPEGRAEIEILAISYL